MKKALLEMESTMNENAMEEFNLGDEMKMESIAKRQKVKVQPKRRSLFNGCPDEIVLIILSFGDMEDIQSTRIWQTANVQHCTVVTAKGKAAKNDNLDNLKWIYNYIGDTKFIKTRCYKSCAGWYMICMFNN